MPGRPNDAHSTNHRHAEAAEHIAFLDGMPPTLSDDAQNGGLWINQPVGDGVRLPSKLRGTAREQGKADKSG